MPGCQAESTAESLSDAEEGTAAQRWVTTTEANPGPLGLKDSGQWGIHSAGDGGGGAGGGGVGELEVGLFLRERRAAGSRSSLRPRTVLWKSRDELL